MTLTLTWLQMSRDIRYRPPERIDLPPETPKNGRGLILPALDQTILLKGP